MKALRALQEALRIDPQSAEAESNLGAALYCMGKTEEATGHLRRAIQLNPSTPWRTTTLGNALLHKTGRQRRRRSSAWQPS